MFATQMNQNQNPVQRTVCTLLAADRKSVV